MEKYLKTYLLAIYSYESDIRIKNKFKLKRNLYLFKKENPYFGRTICCIQLRKLYYVSRLYYEEKHPFYILPDIYIPKPDMISLENKCYYYDYIKPHSYTIFPLFNQKKSYYNQPCLKIAGLSSIIKKIVFTEEQVNIIKIKYHPIIKEKMNSVTTTPTCTITGDINSDNNSIDSINMPPFNNHTMSDIMINMNIDMNRDIENNMDMDIDSNTINNMNIDMESNTINDLNIETFVNSINSIHSINSIDDISINPPTMLNNNYLIQEIEEQEIEEQEIEEQEIEEQEMEEQEMEERIINHLYTDSDTEKDSDSDIDMNSDIVNINNDESF